MLVPHQSAATPCMLAFLLNATIVICQMDQADNYARTAVLFGATVFIHTSPAKPRVILCFI